MLEVKTNSGVSVTVNEDEGKGKLLSFDKPVRLVELASDEATKLGRYLARDQPSHLVGMIHKLIESGFFDKDRTSVDVRVHLQALGVKVKSASLNAILGKMVEQGLLRRKGLRRSYSYYV